MSHSTVLVCLPSDTTPENVEEKLAAALAPFDENKEVGPRREYIEDWQEQWEQALKWRKEHPTDVDKTIDELSVTAVLKEWNGQETFEDKGDGTGPVLYYTMTTYNPQSKWDWYAVGGRWSGYFAPKADADQAKLLPAAPHWSMNTGSVFDEETEEGLAATRGRINGGPKGLIDFDEKRDKDGNEAARLWDRWHKAVAHLPKPPKWAEVRARHGNENIDAARAEYGAYEAVKVMRDNSREFGFFVSYEDFDMPREDYIQKARDSAVPTWACLTLEGDWRERGSMGWFGMSDASDESEATFIDWLNGYLDRLEDDAYLVVVDVHI